MKKFAYCTLIMKGDGYIPGALILGYSLKLFASPDIDIIAMVTSDVSKKGRRLLSDLFKVIEVPYLEYSSNPILLQTLKQKERYGTWLSASYTKWNMLKFHDYSKILFLDADVILIKCIDDIFDFDTPAAVFASPWSKSYYNRGYPDFYEKIKFGDNIPSSDIIKAFHNKGHVLIGSSVLLSPKKGDYEDFIKMLNNNKPFGFKVPSGNDEQAITYFYYLKKQRWVSLPPNLNTIAWKLHMLHLPRQKISLDCFKQGGSKRIKKQKDKKIIRVKKGGFDLINIQDKRKTKDLNKCNLIMCMVPHVIHYFGGTKAWDTGPTKQSWDDLQPFWQLVFNLINSKKKKSEKNNLMSMFNVTSTKEMTTKSVCFWCKYHHLNYSHQIIDSKNELTCPRIKNCISNSHK